MAKSKKKPVTRKASGRRMSGGGSQELNEVLGAVLGYIGAKMVSQKVLPNVSDKIKGLALVGIGQFAVEMMGKSPLFKGVKMGVTIAGADTGLRGFNIISGSGNVAPTLFLPSSSVNGNGINSTVVAGSGDGISQTVVAGNDGYRRRSRYRVDA